MWSRGGNWPNLISVDDSSDVPADAVVPSVNPSEVEPVSGQLVKQYKKRGPKPVETSLRMELLTKLIKGDIPCGELGRVDFIRVCQLTPREKSYLVNHASFKELYDAKLFDLFLGVEILPSKEELKLLEIVARRVGLSKPTTQLNVQVNNNGASKRDDPVEIRVKR